MISLPFVQGFLHTSSGAALGSTAHSKVADPYGYLKKFEEMQYAHSCEVNGKTYVGIRVWSASGRYIKTGGLFALESFISQALDFNEIKIGSAAAVSRSFVDATEILLAGMIALFEENQGIYNSGGSPVEIGQLADIVCELSPQDKTKVIRSSVNSGVESYYCSIEPSIEQVLIPHNLQYSDLRSQVTNTMQYLIWLHSQESSRSQRS
jgi:nucleoside-diphosphate-sugar epimerase